MKIHMFFYRDSFTFSKTALLSGLFLLIMSCSKNGSGKFKLDNAMYFTMQTGAKSYSSFGYTNSQVSDMFGGPEISITYTNGASPKTTLLLVATDNIISGVNTVEFTMGDCYADWYMSKPENTVFGNYKEVIGQLTSNKITLNGTTDYYLDSNGLNLVITKQDTHNGRNTLQGSFTAILRPASDTTKSQGATGSFKAYVK